MEKYNFILKNFHSIKSADIDLNGITVLAGENGCGKSTITRWIYYIVECLVHFEDYAYKDFKESFSDLLREVEMIRRELWLRRDIAKVDIISPQKLRNRLQMSVLSDPNDAECFFKIYEDMLEQFADMLEKTFHNIDDVRRRRLMAYIGIGEKTQFDRDEFVQTYIMRGQECYENYLKVCNQRSMKSLYRYFQHFDDGLDIPVDMHFFEGGVDVLGKKNAEHLLNIERALYVDTPMVLARFDMEVGNTLWDTFRGIMRQKTQEMQTRENRKMIRRIQTIIDGSVVLDIDNLDDELRFIREEDSLNIPIEETATGIKSFAYILRLLENGLLNSRTLLIIDEPEAHLHPQWIVEFARVLVLLHKELGVRILMTSHNPDMVAAIQSISKKENVDANLTFYQAEKSEVQYKYNYRNLEQDISNIFQSFNIALTRIQDYGTMGD